MKPPEIPPIIAVERPLSSGTKASIVWGEPLMCTPLRIMVMLMTPVALSCTGMLAVDPEFTVLFQKATPLSVAVALKDVADKTVLPNLSNGYIVSESLSALLVSTLRLSTRLWVQREGSTAAGKTENGNGLPYISWSPWRATWRSAGRIDGENGEEGSPIQTPDKPDPIAPTQPKQNSQFGPDIVTLFV